MWTLLLVGGHFYFAILPDIKMRKLTNYLSSLPVPNLHFKKHLWIWKNLYRSLFLTSNPKHDIAITESDSFLSRRVDVLFQHNFRNSLLPHPYYLYLAAFILFIHVQKKNFITMFTIKAVLLLPSSPSWLWWLRPFIRLARRWEPQISKH